MEQGCGAAGGAPVSPSKPHNATRLSDIRSVASPTSLLLTQTSPPVKKAVSAYTKVLVGALQGNNDAVAYAFAVNGEWKSADAGTLCFHVAEAAEVEYSRGPTSGPSSKHRSCRYRPSYSILKHNRHGSRDKHPRGPADSACEAGDSRPEMDGIERRFGLGASER